MDDKPQGEWFNTPGRYIQHTPDTCPGRPCSSECDHRERVKLCPIYGQPQPACITTGSAPYFVTGINHVCGR